MSTATFYRAGCPVCLGAEQMLANAIESVKYIVENVHLGLQAERIQEDEERQVLNLLLLWCSTAKYFTVTLSQLFLTQKIRG